MSKMIVTDTETTGFSTKTDRLIEFGAAEFNPETGELGETLHFYINPGIAVPAAATAVHGITTEQLADCPKFADVADQIVNFLRGNIVVAHNARFDVGFLSAELKKAKIKEDFEAMVAKTICTHQLARYCRPNSATNLNAVCDAFGIDRSIRTMHGAMIDCFLTAQIYPHLAKLQAARDAVLVGILPFAPGADLPEDLEFLGKAYVMMNELKNRIEAEQKRVRAVVERLAAGKPVENADFCISFSPGKVTTDWKKIKETYLPGVDLSEFEKNGKPSMTIEAA